MKLATTTSDFKNYTDSQAEALAYIRKAGFRFADYSFSVDYSRKSGIYGAHPEAYFEEIRKAADRIGIRLVQAHAPMGKPIDADNAAFIADTVRCVDACAAWGIQNLVVHSGYAFGLSVEETFAENKKFFTPILERAEKYGIRILVENFNKMHREGVYWVDNATDLLALIEYISHPLCHAIWDVGHANLQEMPQHEEIAKLGKHLCALHIQDNMGEHDSHLAPFFGTMNMDSVMKGLSDIGYNGYFTFEVGSFFTPPEKKRQYAGESRLLSAPLALRCAAERYLYELGKCVLESYDCFEE